MVEIMLTHNMELVWILIYTDNRIHNEYILKLEIGHVGVLFTLSVFLIDSETVSDT